MSYKTLFVLLLLALAATNVYAQDNGLQSTTLSMPPIKENPNEPRIPFSLPTEIECTYSSDYISITIPNEIEYLSVVIEATDGSILWTGIITHEDSDATLPNISGEVFITATTELGLEYSGTLDF